MKAGMNQIEFVERNWTNKKPYKKIRNRKEIRKRKEKYVPEEKKGKGESRTRKGRS